MASDLPQAMLADLQLLHQHYQQLPFVLDSSLGSPTPAAATAGALESFGGSLGLTPDNKAAATAAQQLLTSSPAAAADGTKHKRSRLSRKDAALLRLQKYANSLNSNRSTPSSVAEAIADPNPSDTVVSTAAEARTAAKAAVVVTQPQADLLAAIPTALELTTPPAKPPRSCRGRQAAAPPPPQPTGCVAPADAQLPAAPSGAATSLPAAVPAAGDAAGLPPKKRSRRQSGKQLTAEPAAEPPAAPTAAAAPEADEVDAAAAAAHKSRSRKHTVTAAVTVTEVPDHPTAVISASPAIMAAAMVADTATEADAAAAAAGPTRAGRGRGRSSSAASRGRGRAKGRKAAAAAPEDDAGLLGPDGAAGGSDPDAPAAAAAAAAKPVVKSRRGRRTTAAPAAAGGFADTPSDPEAAAAAAAAAEAKPAKPVRRTKKVIAAEVLEAASQGQFGELTNLSSTYSHVALFTNTSNTAAWQALVQQAQLQVSPADTAAAVPAAEAAAVGQQQQQAGRSSSLSLCRCSGLGSFRQQVWIHSQSQGLGDAEGLGTQDTVFDAEAVGTHAQGTLLPAASQQQQPSATATAAAAGSEGDQEPTGDAAAKQRVAGSSSKAPGDAGAGTVEQVTLPPALPLTPELQQQQQLKVLPNLGYACLCMTMRKYDIFNSRDCVKKTRDAADGLQKVSELALQNARDLLPLIHWNEAHGIRLFRLSSNIFPWMVSYKFEDLPHWPDIQKALRAAGDLAKQLGHRLTFHPSEYCKIAGERPDWVTQSVGELEVHSRIFDEMGFLPATPYNKINIHVGGTYGDKDAALERFSKVVNERLSPNCKARLTVENDDRASLYSVVDLMRVHQATGIPIVFDFHHWKFCTGDQTQEEAFRTALTTWPAGVRPVVHWSESPEDPKKMLKAHSEYVDGPINLFGLEGDVDVMIESKSKELALLEYRQYVVEGCSWPMGPRSARTVKFAADAAAAAAADGSDSEEVEERASSADDE